MSTYHDSSVLTLLCLLAGTLYGLFSQIQSEEAEDNIIRERTIKYLAAKIKTFDKDVMNKEAEEILWTEVKKSLKVGLPFHWLPSSSPTVDL